MLFYLGITILLIATIHLCLFVYGQLYRVRHYQKIYALERVLLQKKIKQLAFTKEGASRKEWSWDGWRKFRVDDIRVENKITKSFYLVPHDGKPLPEYLPGQYLTFRLKIPGVSKPVARCYSLSDFCNNTDRYRISVKHELAFPEGKGIPDGVASSYFHKSLEKGDILDVKAPGGKFFLDETEKTPVVLVAGGIGITPILAMLNSLYYKKSHRSVWLFYAIRDTEQMMMTEHLEEVNRNYKSFNLFRFFSHMGDLNKHDSESNHQGSITSEVMQELGVPMSSADYYICGPKSMIDTVVGGLVRHNVSKDRIHFETFGPASVSLNKEKLENTKPTSGAAIPVSFTVSGKTIDWFEESGTLMDMMDEQGIPYESGCRTGGCGTCETAILEGEVEYENEPEYEFEKGSCLPCVCKPKTSLRLNA